MMVSCMPIKLASPCKECEQLHVQLAGCGVAALGYAKGKNDDVKDLRKKYEEFLKKNK